ncbi:protein of unknown function [Mariniphaga anaerophila]|uniref:3-keto-alpha-glucoside-1,2-lyase/3-keto-2-hydroxy-glucal hydratase domain-containing protein n=1 Tax=Mariniphaga anaerophila TaxID=1484053 RepID=A0A1M5CLX4_9BACT|nr:DUF1080 domain-containing protein [Mariniphaga anaerophila]SHF55718.1 protein of unknown function [Mariniphaga anaerophila]
MKVKRLLILVAFWGFTLLGFAQKNDGFTSLFNGKDLSGWIMPGKVPGFEVADSVLFASPHNGSELFTKEKYGNFVFKFEYLLSEVGNSGVLIRCEPENPWNSGVEIQLLAPWTPYRDDLHCTGSIYGHVAVTNRPDETTGIWHTMEIKCDRENVTISVDGKVTTVANTDTVKSMQGKHVAGSIGFQSNHSKEGEFVKFRNVFVKNMDSDPDYVSKGFYHENAGFRSQAHDAAEVIGVPMIGRLSEMMSGENVMAQAGAKQVLFDIVAKVASDGTKRERNALAKALGKEQKSSRSKAVKSYFEWLLKMAKSAK